MVLLYHLVMLLISGLQRPGLQFLHGHVALPINGFQRDSTQSQTSVREIMQVAEA
jgi:hypothetical protein